MCKGLAAVGSGPLKGSSQGQLTSHSFGSEVGLLFVGGCSFKDPGSAIPWDQSQVLELQVCSHHAQFVHGDETQVLGEPHLSLKEHPDCTAHVWEPINPQ